jgi:membrane protein
MLRPAEAWSRFLRFYRKDIWQPAFLKDKSPRGWLYAFLRIVSITLTVFHETKAASRAAALTFSSLLGLGPLVAIAVLVGGFMLGKNENPHLVADKLSQLLHFLAPQITTLEAQHDAAAQAAIIAANGQPVNVAPSPELVDLINGFINGARSGSAGALGVLSLILIVLLLFKTVEDAFNEIWGVRVGRSFIMRVVFYWTILTLGAVLFFAAITLLGAGAFVNVFMERLTARLPYGTELLRMLSWMLPAGSMTMLVGLLTYFYRLIPNTRVFWRSAFAGGVVVAVLLMLNNYVALFYVRRVMLTQSLYGSLGVVPVLMLGLYVFWLYVLVGGIISYAVQNVHFRNSQAAWSQLSESIRERLSLVVLLTICRRFQACLPPVAATHLSTLMRVPTQILNESLNRLVDMKLITPVPPPPGSDSADHLYQPSRPLNRISLLEFKQLDDNLGDDPMSNTLEQIDPILQHYDEALGRVTEQKFFQKNLEELLADYPFDESRPPFAKLMAK